MDYLDELSGTNLFILKSQPNYNSLSMEEKFNLSLSAIKRAAVDDLTYDQKEYLKDIATDKEFSPSQQTKLFVEAILILLSMNSNALYFLIDDIPNSIKPDVLKECMEKDWTLVKYIYRMYLTPELARIAINLNYNALDYVAQSNIMDKKYIRKELTLILSKKLKQRLHENTAINELLKARTKESVEEAIRILKESDSTSAKFLELLLLYNPELSFLDKVGGTRKKIQRKSMRRTRCRNRKRKTRKGGVGPIRRPTPVHPPVHPPTPVQPSQALYGLPNHWWNPTDKAKDKAPQP